SRCHHLLWLGEAYMLTGDDKYSKEVVDEIEYWIDDNPLMYSVNWTCAMDVAIRSVNWMFAVNMILPSNVVTDKFITKIYKSLYQHGFFIYNYLEKNIPYSNNHYASDLVGLLYLGQLFKNTNSGKAWWNFAKHEYYLEIRLQILPSGVHYEKSVSYHRLMTELFSYSYYMMKRVNVEIPMDIALRLHSMYKYVAAYTKPNGKAPLIADNDNGRLLPFVRRDFREHGYLLDKNSIENRFVISEGCTLCEVSPVFGSILFNDAGLAILRKDKAYLFVNCNDRGLYDDDKVKVGTHLHNDLLSFEFALGEDDIIIDPGAYVYTSDLQKQNEFRSSFKHNTIVVDDEEQNTLFLNEAFMIEYNTKADRLQLSSNENEESCIGIYSTIKGCLNHKRKFILSNKQLIINDYLSKTGTEHKACLSLHFAADILPMINNNGLLIKTNNYHIVVKFEFKDSFNLKIKDDSVSPSFGVLRNSKTAIIEFTFNEYVEFKTNITWTRK
ncbi:MAG: alginate lyase family protein, partial [Erysipelotrichales bacterium]|nr:alginate lyase family protein [Erysipelotrichales bacterium]